MADTVQALRAAASLSLGFSVDGDSRPQTGDGDAAVLRATTGALAQRDKEKAEAEMSGTKVGIPALGQNSVPQFPQCYCEGERKHTGDVGSPSLLRCVPNGEASGTQGPCCPPPFMPTGCA